MQNSYLLSHIFGLLNLLLWKLFWVFQPNYHWTSSNSLAIIVQFLSSNTATFRSVFLKRLSFTISNIYAEAGIKRFVWLVVGATVPSSKHFSSYSSVNARNPSSPSVSLISRRHFWFLAIVRSCLFPLVITFNAASSTSTLVVYPCRNTIFVPYFSAYFLHQFCRSSFSQMCFVSAVQLMISTKNCFIHDRSNSSRYLHIQRLEKSSRVLILSPIKILDASNMS